MKNKRKYIKGITLISLVITIIILIILAGVTIYLSLGNNGIFTTAKQAKEATNKQEATDIINLKITTAEMNKYAEKQQIPTLQELADILYEDNEIQYVALETQVASKEKVTVGDKTSIFTKLNQYPYEFEIDKSLRLASINGIKVGKNENNSIDYSDNKNEVILTKKVQVTTNRNDWGNIDFEGPEIESGTWLIFIDILDEEDSSSHQTILVGTGCCSSIVPTNTWAGVNCTSGYYKGEKTNLIARIYNGSDKTRNYTLTFKALKLSNTY